MPEIHVREDAHKEDRHAHKEGKHAIKLGGCDRSAERYELASRSCREAVLN